jgi:hypothetical protein
MWVGKIVDGRIRNFGIVSCLRFEHLGENIENLTDVE